ncbi:GEL complex subunit OPTI isoform X2 [Tachypleus tridentatus]|uniref:GEL complex subunit OPTI isoform X2 n=1 Tax=Tachypleus tridentatus TaxID=6853 RepID=UPI003FD3790B
MIQKRKPNERNGSVKNVLPSLWARATTPGSKWPDKDEFLDVIYWARQVIGIIIGVLWGLLQVKGFIGISLFCLMNALVVYVYTSIFHKVDEEEFGGLWELVKEGFMTSFAGFLVGICVCTLHLDNLV